VLTVMSQNICRGGQDRWSGLARIIRAVDPDILLLQEAKDFGRPERMKTVKEDLPGLKFHLAPSQVGGNVVAWRPDRLKRVVWETHLSGAVLYGFGTATFRMDELDVPLSVISAHLTPYSAAAAAQEAQVMIARLYRNNGLGLLGGDINHLPVSPDLDPDPDWSSVPPYNRSSRTIAGSRWTGDRIVGETLGQGDLVDVAACLAEQHGDFTLCGPTGIHGGIRVDQFRVTRALAPGGGVSAVSRRARPAGYR
jgi:hypothetical protein